MKLLLDEMWPPDAALQLRRQGHDVAAVAERLDLRGQPDAVIFGAAQREERAVVTENVVDYRQLAAREIHQGRRHHGVILTTNRRFPATIPGRWGAWSRHWIRCCPLARSWRTTNTGCRNPRPGCRLWARRGLRDMLMVSHDDATLNLETKDAVIPAVRSSR